MTDRDSKSKRINWSAWVGGLTFALPLVVATHFLGLSPGWLDSPELTAASASLGLSHPPGHPSYLFFSHLFTLLPLGSIPFRMAFFSAFCLGLASWLAYRTVLHIQAIAIGEHTLSLYYRCLTAIPILFASCTYTVLLQAVRPEVYTFHAALALGVFERMLSSLRHVYITQIENVEDERPWGLAKTPLYSVTQAALLFGLGLANHHYLMLLTVPGSLWLLIVMWRSLKMSWKRFILLCAAVSIGLMSYAYLPARSVQSPAIHWGNAHSIQSFTWHVTAQAWQKSVRSKNRREPLVRRWMALSSIYIEQFGLGCAVALMGLYILIRTASRVGFPFLLWGAGVFVGRLLMRVERWDADLHGYLVVSIFLFVGCCAFLAVWIASKCTELRRSENLERRSQILAFLGQGAAVLIVLIPFAWFPQVWVENSPHVFSPRHCDKRKQAGPLLWGRLMEEPLPYGTLLLTSYYQNGFLRWYRNTIEKQRPDIQMIQRNLMVHPNIAKLESKRFPKLASVLNNWGTHPKRAFAALRKLTQKRNVCFEWWKDIPLSIAKELTPIGMFFCWFPRRKGQVQSEDDRAIQEQQNHFWREVYKVLGVHIKADRENRNVLIWTHFQHALFYQKTKRWHSGLAEVKRALRLSPKSRILQILARTFSRRLRTGKTNPTLR